MKQKIDVLIIFSITAMILFLLLSLGGCGSGGDDTPTGHTSGDDIYTPVEVKLVHR